MKRTALIAVVIVAMALAAAGFAVANSDNDSVVVSARINPAIDLTVSDAALDFGAVNVGTTQDLDTNIRVRSNKIWNLTKDVDYGPTPELASFLTDDVAETVGNARGVENITATFTLDLDSDAAYVDLEGDEDYTATFTYTATQQ